MGCVGMVQHAVYCKQQSLQPQPNVLPTSLNASNAGHRLRTCVVCANVSCADMPDAVQKSNAVSR